MPTKPWPRVRESAGTRASSGRTTSQPLAGSERDRRQAGGAERRAAHVHGVRPACDRPAFAMLVDGAERVTVPGVRLIDGVPSVQGRVVPRTMWSC